MAHVGPYSDRIVQALQRGPVTAPQLIARFGGSPHAAFREIRKKGYVIEEGRDALDRVKTFWIARSVRAPRGGKG